MPYHGEVLTSCGTVNIDLSNASVIAVSGDGINACGHLLLYVPSGGGYYFHVAGVHEAPRYMTESGYRRYLTESGKRELRRRSLRLPDPAGAYLHLEGLLAEKWFWGAVPHNCVSFVEEIISAGGGDWGSYSNCPAVATSDSMTDRINRFYQWMESGIYGLYGVRR